MPNVEMELVSSLKYDPDDMGLEKPLARMTNATL